MRGVLWSACLALILGLAFGGAACGSSGSGFTNENGQPDSGGTVLGDGGGGGGSDGGLGYDSTTPPPPSLFDASSSDAAQILAISPTAVTLAVTLGNTTNIPTQQFTATYGGATVGAQFTFDRGEIGGIGVSSGVFTPGAQLGGIGTVTATYQGHTVTASVNVKITYVSAGDPNAPDGGDAGAGGFGGVGGSGEGAPATPVQSGTLDGTPTPDPNIGFLYPYDKTVFPQAVLPPLLQWSVGTHAFTAVRIHITETSYEYKGYFQAPATPFQNHPLPKAVWDAISYSNAGEAVNVELTFAEGTNAVGPITESWKIAQGELKGTIYYNSYGTNLAHNYCCALDPTKGTDTGAKFGGATLAIREGQTSPELVAGDDNNCRVCHSVSSDGSTLITQHGDNYGITSSYALTNSNAEATIANISDSRFEYAGVYPDGSWLFSHENQSALYDIKGVAVPGVTGIPSGLSAFLPAFSPDGTHIAFNTSTDHKSLAALDFAKGTVAFSNLRTLYTPAKGNAYWPSFLPTNDGLVFELETASNGRDTAGTRSTCDNPSGESSPDPANACHSEGTHAELWWVDLATHNATRLDNLNGLNTTTGKAYVPPHPSYTGTLGDDTTLNYEPTVNPVPSGGYAWVVFTSRRLYGNVATINPFWSDPRFEDISKNPTPKKLWVAAIDLNAAPGTDPSHPAFYLPAQELLAGNARGFWVVDPCQKDGTSCVSGDQCCGGYCRPGTDGGLMCTATQPSCSQEFEKCTTTADCCGAAIGIQCIDMRCAQTGPR
jgi:hypothetical protein